MPVLDATALADERIQAIRRYHQSAGVKRAEIDVSGGIDSAVIFSVLVRALGADQVTAAFLSINSSNKARDRARAVADSLGARLVVDELSAEFNLRMRHMVDRLVDAGYDRDELERRLATDPTILGSIRSCMRAPLGRGYNRLTGGGIRHGTGNEDEDRFLRFYQKGGDGEVDTNPIAMLSKGEVYQLALALGVPRVVIDVRPSPDLWGDDEKHNDEDELKSMTGGVAWTYSRIDVDSGQYRTQGSIERVARYLDSIDDGLFDDGVAVEKFTTGHGVAPAAEHPAFRGLDRDQVEALLRSAKKVERQTRHKLNPNIPALGIRRELLAAGILTNDLPEL
ncbi:MAG: NAD(+) synthase [Pseudomonadota bacterium]